MEKQEKPRDTETKKNHQADITYGPIHQKVVDWGTERASEMERRYMEISSTENEFASKVHCRKVMLYSVFEVLGKHGLSREELIEVLSNTKILWANLREEKQNDLNDSTETLSSRLEDIDKIIHDNLEEIADSVYKTKDLEPVFSAECAILYLFDSRGCLQQSHSTYDSELSSTLLDTHQNFYVGIVNIALHDQRAISWNPKADDRLKRESLGPKPENDVLGSLIAIRLDDWHDHPMGVIVVSSNFNSTPANVVSCEEFIFDELVNRCVNLRNNLQLRCNLLDLLGKSITGTMDKAATYTSEIEQLYNELAKLRAKQNLKLQDHELSEKIRKCRHELRALQLKESKIIEGDFLNSLSLPLEKSDNLLQDAEEMIKRYANHSKTDQASDESDESTT